MYINIDDIKKQVSQDTLVQLTDDNLSGNIDTVVIDEAIIYSETLIDGYLRGRYVLPLNTIPAVVKILAVDLSICRLYSRRFHTEMPEAISEKYKNSIKILEQIQKGIISLGIEPLSSSPELGAYRTNKTYQDREFSKQVLNRY